MAGVVDHGVAAHPQDVDVLARRGELVEGEGLGLLEGLDRRAGGDRAEDPQLGIATVGLDLVLGHELEPAADALLGPAEDALALELLDVPEDRDLVQAEALGDLLEGRADPVLLVVVLEEVEDLALAAGERDRIHQTTKVVAIRTAKNRVVRASSRARLRRDIMAVS